MRSDRAPAMTAPAAGVKVRMYRQGLGDCFLLAFATGAGRPFYMLIDCGVLLGTPDAGEKMRQVAESLRDSTGGRIDVLVATHQHWDHLSGFDQAREVFDQIDFGEVWVGWTEDPQQRRSRNRLRARRGAHLRALARRARSLRAVGAATEGRDPGGRARLLRRSRGWTASPSRIERALDYVLGRGKPPRYRAPGETVGLPRLPPRRVYVLGPPLDEALLLRSDPSQQASEVYEKRLGLTEETAFFAAVLAADRAGPEPRADGSCADLSFPFDGVYRVDPEPAKADEFFQTHYYGEARGRQAGRSTDDGLAADRGGLARPPPTTSPCSSTATPTTPASPWRSSSPPAARCCSSPATPRWATGSPGTTGSVEREDTTRHGRRPAAPHRLLQGRPPRQPQRDAAGEGAGADGAAGPGGDDPGRRADGAPAQGGNPDGWDMPFPPLLERLKEKTRGRVLRADSGSAGAGGPRRPLRGGARGVLPELRRRPRSTWRSRSGAPRGRTVRRSTPRAARRRRRR